MSLAEARRNQRRFHPRVEALEDRSLLSATLTGLGKISTTAAVNHVLITDDGTSIKVLSDNGPVATFLEGTAVTVSAKVKGSTNFVEYDLLGSAAPNAAASTTIVGGLTVNFGTGNGQLLTQVVSTLPTSLLGPPGPLSNLGQNSNVQITATSSSGNTQDVLRCVSLGNGANLSDVDNGGRGNDVYGASLSGTEFLGASVNLKFTGGDGNNTGLVFDTQDVQGGASAIIDLRCKGDSDDHNLLGVGYGTPTPAALQGSLNVTADAGPGTNTVILNFELASGSSGSLSSSAKTGPGAAQVTDVVHKDAADSPSVTETATGIGSGLKQGFFTIGNSATSVAVINSGFASVTVDP
jgi:hypothetical protein